MSNEYYEAVQGLAEGESLDMRRWCQRPGNMDEDGNPIYFTEQSHKAESDINNIIRRYDRTGLIMTVTQIEGKYGDMSGADFKMMMDKVANAKSMFEALPSDIRKRFENSPQRFLEFFEDSKNRDEAIELGLISPDWTVETDGLGEHVLPGDQIVKGDGDLSKKEGEQPSP